MYSNEFQTLIKTLFFVNFLVFIWAILQLLMGYKIFRATIVFAGMLIGAIIGYLLTKSFFGAFLAMLAGGAALWYFYKAAVFVSGFLFGFLIAVVLFLLGGNAGMGDIAAFGLIFGIAGGIIALFYHKLVIILSTAFTGAFFIVFYMTLIFTGNLQELSENAVWMVFFIILLGYVGVYFQYKLEQKTFKNDRLSGDAFAQESKQSNRPFIPESILKNMDVVTASLRSGFNNPTDSNRTSSSSPKNYTTQDVVIAPRKEIPLSLLQLSGNYKNRRYQVKWRRGSDGQEAVVGKATANNFPDVNIPESVISRKHALLKHKNGQLFIVHLSATNPTYKNNQPLQANTDYPLQKGDKLIFGDIHFKIE